MTVSVHSFSVYLAYNAGLIQLEKSKTVFGVDLYNLSSFLSEDDCSGIYLVVVASYQSVRL